jgi:hypothetical protein
MPWALWANPNSPEAAARRRRCPPFLVSASFFSLRSLQPYEVLSRRAVAKAEFTSGEANPRFVVTSLRSAECKPKYLYEKVYCARGDMENRIKECQLDLYADRTSTATMRANQLRLWLASMAYVLLRAVRRIALHHTPFANASCGTIRLKLLKIGTLVRVSVRRIKIAMASSCPAGGTIAYLAGCAADFHLGRILDLLDGRGRQAGIRRGRRRRKGILRHHSHRCARGADWGLGRDGLHDRSPRHRALHSCLGTPLRKEAIALQSSSIVRAFIFVRTI